MSKVNKPVQEGVSEAVRTEIAKIPPGELSYAKPSRVLPCLEAGGFEITPSVRSITSKLLKMAKRWAPPTGEVISVAGEIAERRVAEDRKELAMRLVEACGGGFEFGRCELARLEEFARKIRACWPGVIKDMAYMLDLINTQDLL